MHREVVNQCFLIASFIAIVSATVQLDSVTKDFEKAPKRPTDRFQEQPAEWSAELPTGRTERQPTEESVERPAVQVHPVQFQSSYKKGYIGKNYLDRTIGIGDNDVLPRDSSKHSVESVVSENEEVRINQQELADERFEATSQSLFTPLQSNLSETGIQDHKTSRDGLVSGRHVHQNNDKNFVILKYNKNILRTLNVALEYTQLFSSFFSQVAFNTTWEVVSTSSFEEDDTMLWQILPALPDYETPPHPFFSTRGTPSSTYWFRSKAHLATSMFTSTSGSSKSIEDVDQFCQQVVDNSCRVDRYVAALQHVAIDQVFNSDKLLLLQSIDSIVDKLHRVSNLHYKAMKVCRKAPDQECCETILNTVYTKCNNDDRKMRGVRTTRQLLKGLRYMKSIYSKFKEPRRQ